MNREKIINEIKTFDTKKCVDGVSFCEHTKQTGKLTRIEQLLMFSGRTKYYYNYSEKKLREVEVKLRNIIEKSGDDIFFVCFDKEDDTKIDIYAKRFSEKIICFEDYHKVIVYDEASKQYECFFVDMTKKNVEDFFKDVHKYIPDDVKKFVLNEYGDEVATEEAQHEAFDELGECFNKICEYMHREDTDLTEIRFTNLLEGVQVDLVTSRLWQPSNNSFGSN